jgi:hypothetical protein
LNRLLYLAATYSGLRALFNLFLSIIYDPGRVSRLNYFLVALPGLGMTQFRVHGRPRPTNGCSSAKYGMISLSLIRPGLNQFVYRLIRLTSHFGCGHLELAYMDIDGGIEIYAVRNILKANISRLHLNQAFSSLRTITNEDEHRVLTQTISVLGDHGITCRLAAPSECCRLALSHRLLNPRTQAVIIGSLHRKYKRMSRKLGYQNVDVLQINADESRL